MAATEVRPTPRSDYRVAVIGTGVAGQGHVARLWICQGVDVVAACSRDDLRRAEFCERFDIQAGYADYAAMLRQERLDGVIIATAHNVLADACARAMRVCGAILVEKPLARSAAEADQLLQVQHQTGARVLVAYPRRFRNHYVAARHWIENGEIGAFRYGAMEWCDVHMGSYLGTGDSRDRTFRNDPAAAVHGVLLDHGSHMLDSFLWLTGQRITAVSATLRFGSKGLDCAALLSLEIGDVGLASAAIYPAQSGRQERRISVQGTAGRIVIDDETAALYRGRSHAELVAHAPEELRLTESYLAMLANEPSAGCDLRQGCDVVRVIDAAYRSFDHDVAVHL